MKKNISKYILVLSSLPFFLAGCAPESFQFLGGKEGYWGDDYYFNDDDDSGDWSNGNSNDNDNGSEQSSSQGSSGDAHGGSDGQSDDIVTFDENSTKFGHSFSGTGAGEVAIYAKTENCTDLDLIVPGKYIDSKGTEYQVTKDINNGFNALQATKISLPNGFKEIVQGFDNCMYLKTIYLPSTITSISDDVIVNCISLTKIDFSGTKAQWNSITKGERWNYTAKALSISCSDGFIELQSWAESHS